MTIRKITQAEAAALTKTAVADPRCLYWGSFEGDQLAGVAGLKITGRTATPLADYVRPEFRGMGHFKALTDFRIRQARLLGVRRLSCLVTPMSEPYWRKLGAEVVQEFKRFKRIRLTL
jgi:GNAT superfamily N-acetyltransferase